MSTFKELYDDFLDIAKLYTEKLDVTEVSFMRMYTKGVQDFQKKVGLIAIVADVSKNNDGDFPEPSDILHLLGIRDEDGKPIEHRDMEQLYRNVDNREAGYYNDPMSYDRNLIDGGFIADHVTMASIRNRVFIFYPEYTGTVIKVHYIPDMQPFSQVSRLWYPSAFGDGTAGDWFPINTNFESKFTTWSVHPYLAPYEQAFLDYALAKWIGGQGNPAYSIFQQQYEREVAYAVQNKRLMFRGAMPSYAIGPGAY